MGLARDGNGTVKAESLHHRCSNQIIETFDFSLSYTIILFIAFIL